MSEFANYLSEHQALLTYAEAIGGRRVDVLTADSSHRYRTIVKWRATSVQNWALQNLRFCARGGDKRARAKPWAGGSSKPVLNFQTSDTLELVGIGGHDGGANRGGVSRDQQIVAADRLSGCFQFRADSAVVGVGR